MANFLIRRRPQADVDPLRLIRDQLRRFQALDPYADLTDMEPVVSGVQNAALFDPDFDIHESEDEIVIRADLPGVRQDDLDINVMGNRLRIVGKRELEN